MWKMALRCLKSYIKSCLELGFAIEVLVIMGNWPSLVLPQFCKTPVHLVLHGEGVDEDGAPIKALELDALCNYQGSAKRVRTDKETFVQLTGICLFNGDVAPSVLEIGTGEAIIFGEKRTIVSGKKARNPDGSVNYCEVDLG